MATMTIKRETVNGKEMVFIAAELSPHPSSTGKTEILFSSGGFDWQQGMGINLLILKSKYDK